MNHHKKRFEHTIKFLKNVLPAPATILDLGTRNAFSEIMEENGYKVYNTEGEDFDLIPEIVKKYKIAENCGGADPRHFSTIFRNFARRAKMRKNVIFHSLIFWPIFGSSGDRFFTHMVI